ncbi:septum formation inhibitor Maf [Lacinutrix sp. MEBiC02404]
MNTLLKAFFFLAIFSILSCQQDKKLSTDPITTKKEKEETPLTNQFKEYWYSGKAELNSYTLKQSRYGEIRDGEVVLVFVTEPFSLSKQVKLDNPQDAREDNVSVLKLNNIRKFTTGIYDYSIVTSSFTPVDSKKYPHTLKLNTSIQEWCGHTFTQLNLEEENYNFKQFSYFEADGDTEKTIPAALLEEELMTHIRLNNGQLPLGEIDLIFSTIYSRFGYHELKSTKAKISKTESDSIISYTIAYLNYERKLSIAVENEFPYKILSWTEDDGDGLITEAQLKKSINEPYWNQKSLGDEAKRKELQLIK